jgi:hypothetical protein
VPVGSKFASESRRPWLRSTRTNAPVAVDQTYAAWVACADEPGAVRAELERPGSESTPSSSRIVSGPSVEIEADPVVAARRSAKWRPSGLSRVNASTVGVEIRTVGRPGLAGPPDVIRVLVLDRGPDGT